MAVTMYNERRNVVGRFNSERTVYSLTGIRSHDVRRVLEGQRSIAGGYEFRETKRLTPTHGERHVRVFNDDNVLVAVFRDMDTLKRELAPHLRIRNINGRHEIYRSGDNAAAFYVVEAGPVA